MTSRLKPIQLLWFIATSNVFVTATVILMNALTWRIPEGHHLPGSIKTPCVTVMGISLAAGFFGEWLLQRGVRSGAWSRPSLDHARSLVTHPVVRALSSAIGIFAILCFFVSPTRWLSSFGLVVCLPLSLSRVSTTLKRKEPEFTTIGLSAAAPSPARTLHSERWGN